MSQSTIPNDPATEFVTKVAVNIITELFKTSSKGIKSVSEWLKTKNTEYDLLGFAAEKYYKQIETRYNIIKIFGMSEPVSLRDIFVRLNIYDKITSERRHSIDILNALLADANKQERLRIKIQKSAQILTHEINTRDGLDVVNQYSKLLLLGKPGSGKTTFLKHVALMSLDGKLKEPVIPIFISLKDWFDLNIPLNDYIVSEFDICNFPNAADFIEKMLNDGNFILLLDGFDEISGNLKRAIHQIKKLTEKFHKNKFIISCRVAAYNYVFQHFKNVEIADFNNHQITQFAHNWFGKNSKQSALFIDKLNKNEPIKELAAIPLLLTLFCLAFQELLDFPKNKSELYKEAIDALLKKWDSSRGIKRDDIYKHLSLIRKENMLSKIAAELFENSEYFVPRRVMEDKIASYIKNLPNINADTITPDSESILKAMEAQHGIILERAKGIHSFSHLTIQEYFTAKYIVSNEAAGSIKHLIKHGLVDDKYREVFLITSGMLPDASSFFTTMRDEIDNLIKKQETRTIIHNVSDIGKGKNGQYRAILRSAFFYDAMNRIEANFRNYPDAINAKVSAESILKRLGKLVLLKEVQINDGTRRKLMDDLLLKRSHNIAEKISSDLSQSPRSSIIKDFYSYCYAMDLLLECLCGEVYCSKDLRNKLILSLFRLNFNIHSHQTWKQNAPSQTKRKRVKIP